MTNGRGVAVSADTFTAVIRAYADRVHDDVRRLGCSPTEATQIVETSASDLLESLVHRPGSVTDLVGMWFREARVLATRVVGGGSRDTDPDEEAGAPGGVVRDADDDLAAREALAALEERDRHTLLLRDAYGLPYSSTAVALGVDPTTAALLIAQARLRFLVQAGGEVKAPGQHNTDIVRTSRLADGSLEPEETRSAEAHARRCPTCKTLHPLFVEARRLLSGLAIIAMPDTERDALLTRLGVVADRMLPSAEKLAAVVAAGSVSEAQLPRAGIVAACLAGALVLGSLTGVATSGGGGGRSSFFGDRPEPSESVTASVASVTPTLSASPTATATPSATRTATSSPTPTSTEPTFSESPTSRPATITVTPASGPNCRDVRVRGRDWSPGAEVVITYRSLTGQELTRADDVVDATGRFSVLLAACDPSQLPGPHEVRASGGGQTVSGTYTATA